jgi:hypothetical protein
MFKKTTVMAAVAAITLSSAIAHAQSTATPSLAEVARQTAASWATGKKATKVYTNASLATIAEDASAANVTVATAAPATVNTPTTQGASAPAPAAATGKDPAATAGGGAKVEDENAWRNEAASKHRDVAQARAALEKLQTAQPPTAERQLQQAQREVAYFERRLSTFLKAAEAAKVPPAWVAARP